MKTYVNANKNTCAINCITDYLWEGRSFKESLNGITETDLYTPHKWNYELYLATQKELEKASQSLTYLKKMFNKDRRTYIQPFYNNLKSYIKEILETNKTIEEIQVIIQRELLLIKSEMNMQQTNMEKDQEELNNEENELEI